MSYFIGFEKGKVFHNKSIFRKQSSKDMIFRNPFDNVGCLSENTLMRKIIHEM
jgi:hypothetical protein